MTDSSNGSAGAPPGTIPPGTIPPGDVPGGSPQTLPISINTQYVKDLSFENPNAPQSLVQQASQPNIEVNVNVQARGLGPNVYEVVLSITCTAKHETMTAFIVEVAYAGVFTLNNVPQEHIHPLLLIECPRLLFPFARALVANATREGGFLPLLIQPIDFLDLYRRQAAAQGAGAIQPPPPPQGD
jgi:preprotein translocase subunit SecB